MKKCDNGKTVYVIDNRNYPGEPKWLWRTYYGVYNSPISALLSLVRKK